MAKVLTAYYSRAGENYFNGEIHSIEVGNTERLVNKLEHMFETAVFKIEMKDPYPDNYNETLARAEADKNNDYRPELVNYMYDLDGYDTVILCFPSFFGTVPQPVKSFCQELYWQGKYIIPICTNEGSGIGNAREDLYGVCPGAVICRGFSVNGTNIEASLGELEQWLFVRGVK